VNIYNLMDTMDHHTTMSIQSILHCLTLLGPAYFEKKLRIFQLQKLFIFPDSSNVNVRKLSKCDIL
jgi:hypothetical protein